MTDFFNDRPNETQTVTEEKFKLGDQEFSAQELQDMVGIAQQVKEVESKYNTKMDKVFPEYIKTTQKLKEAEEYKEKYTALEAQIESQKQASSAGLTQEQIEQARKQLYDIMGGKPLTDKDADAWYQARRSQEKLAESIDMGVSALMSDIRKDGKPEVSREELLTFMGENNIAKPDIAYKIMKEQELDEWKAGKLSSGKRSGLYTVTHSSAGGKAPAEVRPTMSNIEAMVSEALGGNE